MKFIFIKYRIVLLFVCVFVSHTNAQVFFNNGAPISIQSGAVVMLKTTTLNNYSGSFQNAGITTIEGNFINEATANGGGSNGQYYIQGDWINNGTFISDYTQVTLYGGNQLISGSSNTDFYHLTLSGTGIKTQTINTSVNFQLDLNDCELATDVNILNITNTNPNAITRTSGFVSSLGIGRLSRIMNTPSSYLFPVGSSVGLTRYRPIAITPSDNSTQQYNVRMANTDATSEGFDRSIKAATICLVNPNYFHYIDQINGSSPVTLQFYYDPLVDGNWGTVGHWQNTPEWQNTGPATSAIISPFTELTLSGWNDFSYPPFALINIGPWANISGNASFCQGASTLITFTGTPGATITYTVNGGSPQTLILDASGNAVINTGMLNATQVYQLLNAYMAATPLCVSNYSIQATITVTAVPSTTPVLHD